MSSKENREELWMKYHLGEATPEEKEIVEKELLASPDKAAAFQQFIAQLSQWAKEPVPYTPIKLDEILPAPAGSRPESRGKSFFNALKGNKWAWGLAAAALLVFALSQVQLTVTTKNGSVVWGRGTHQQQLTKLDNQVVALTNTVSQMQQEAAENRQQLRFVTLKNSLLERDLNDAVTQLAYNQQLESQTRYDDVRRLMSVTGAEQNVIRKNPVEQNETLPLENLQLEK